MAALEADHGVGAGGGWQLAKVCMHQLVDNQARVSSILNFQKCLLDGYYFMMHGRVHTVGQPS